MRTRLHAAMLAALVALLIAAVPMWEIRLRAVTAFVEAAGTGDNAAANISITVAGGNTVIVCWRPADNTTSLGSISDGLSNTYTLVRRRAAASAVAVEMWIAHNVTGGDAVINPDQDGRAQAIEISGVVTASAVDQQNDGTGTGTSWTTSATPTTTQANEFIIGCSGLATYQSGNPTPTTGYTLTGDIAGGRNWAEYQVVSSTGTYSMAMTGDTSTVYAAVIATLKDVTAGGSSAAPRLTLLGVGAME